MKPSKILRNIKANPDKDFGICTNYHLINGQCNPDILIMDMAEQGISFKDWKHFSGSLRYPVPAHIDAEKAYDNFDRWSKKSKYGQLRWQLLDWLIEQFEAKGA
jgi:hypothetical protein